MNFNKVICLCHKYLTFPSAVDVSDVDLDNADNVDDNDLDDTANDSSDTLATIDDSGSPDPAVAETAAARPGLGPSLAV